LFELAFLDRLIWTALTEKKNQLSGHTAISPEGTAENSPGRTRISCVAWWNQEASCGFPGRKPHTQTCLEQRAGNPGQSWVFIPTETSPAGTAENAPGRQSWVNLSLLQVIERDAGYA